MPKALDELASKLKSQGYDSDSAYAIATAQLQKQSRMKKANGHRKSSRSNSAKHGNH